MTFEEWWENHDFLKTGTELESVAEAAWNAGRKDIFNPQWSDEELKKFNDSNKAPYKFNKLPEIETYKIEKEMNRPYGTLKVIRNTINRARIDLMEYLRRRDDEVLKKLLAKMCGDEITEKIFKDFEYAKEIINNLHLRFEKRVYHDTESQKDCMIMYQNDKEVSREYYD